MQHSHAGFGSKVQGHRLFAPIERLKIQGVLVRCEGRNVSGDITPGTRVLDFDHLGAHVGQNGRAERPCAEL